MAILYAAKGGASTTSDLYTVDPATAAVTSLGATGYALTGLAFDPTTEILYGATSPNSSASPRSLITLDTTTGAGTLVGGFGAVVADICFDSTGQMYGFKPSGDKLTLIDKATGTCTDRTGIGFSANGNGLTCDSTDTLWLFPFGSGGFLYTVNKTTGAGTNMGTLDDGLTASNTISAAAIDVDDLLYGVCIASPSILFTVGAIVIDIYPLTQLGTFATGNWDALAWSPDTGGGALEGVCIAFDDAALTAEPVWTRIDL